MDDQREKFRAELEDTIFGLITERSPKTTDGHAAIDQGACMTAAVNVLATLIASSPPDERKLFCEEVGRALKQKAEQFAAEPRYYLMRTPPAKQ